MKMKTRSNKNMLVVLALTVFTFILLAGGALAGTEKQSSLKARAEKVFAYDQTNPKTLPANKIRALSMALTFHNEQGASELLSQLESAIQ